MPGKQDDATISQAYREHRPYLVDLAFRTLGDLGAAEDVVQDAFARLLRADAGEIIDETFLLTSGLSRPHAVAGIGVFALAGLGCSALLPLTISFGEADLTAMAAAMAGGVIAFYQLGYGIAAFGVGPLHDSGTSLSRIFGFTAIIAAVMALLSFFVTRRHAPAGLAAEPDPSLRLVPGAGDQRNESR